MQIGGRYTHHFGVRAVNGQPQYVKCAALRPVIRSPVEGRIDHDFAPKPRAIDIRGDIDDFAGAIGAENNRELDARVLPLSDEDVPMVECGRSQADDRLSGARIRIGTFFESKMLDIADRM
jgi:hypothetical protein